MKSFFSGLKLGAPSPANVPASSAGQPAAKRAASQGEQQMPDMLGKAEKLLHKLRSSKSHDFPLLNEATRLGKCRDLLPHNMPCMYVTRTQLHCLSCSPTA